VRYTRWDYQFFRCFNLLEAIADTVVPPNKMITDAAGNPRLLANKKDPYQTGTSQVYELLMHTAPNDPTSAVYFTSQQPNTNFAAADQSRLRGKESEI
jgi:hypothetical protein